MAKESSGVRRRSCTVYLGSSFGTSSEYLNAVTRFAGLLYHRGWDIVYGGSKAGLMGALADAGLKAGAEVRGVEPQALMDMGVAHPGLTELTVVHTMHDRKQRMFDMGDMAVAMPGGVGTWEEILEILAWSRLGYHSKPVGVLNIRGYYDPLLELLDRSVKEGFMTPESLSFLMVGSDPEDLLKKLEGYSPPNRGGKAAESSGTIPSAANMSKAASVAHHKDETSGKGTQDPASAPGQRRRNCTVYLGSSFGNSPDYRVAVEGFARALAKRGCGIVYGGNNVGLMGALADTGLQAGAEVRGVVPLAMMGLAHQGLTELTVVSSMHERKQRMLEMGDMAVAMPGGVGTWEEILEVLAWAHLDFHRKPVGILNTRGYYDPLLGMLDRSVEEGFLRPEFLSYLVVGKDPEELVGKLDSYNPVRVSKVPAAAKI